MIANRRDRGSQSKGPSESLGGLGGVYTLTAPVPLLLWVAVPTGRPAHLSALYFPGGTNRKEV